jgi:hypothetical protein
MILIVSVLSTSCEKDEKEPVVDPDLSGMTDDDFVTVPALATTFDADLFFCQSHDSSDR